MLKSLHIKNLAVVEDVTLDFDRGLNVLTGSTGAGKSLILGAVNILRGSRVDAGIMRKGESTALVEATFMMEGDAYRPPDSTPGDCEVVLARKINAGGRSRAYVNGRPVALGAMTELARELIEPHGQNEQMKLKSRENHIVYLDGYAGLDRMKREYASLLEEFDSACGRLEAFNEKMALVREKREILKHRIEDLSRADLKVGEKEELEKKVALLENSHRILEAVGTACDLLYENELSAWSMVRKSSEALERIAGVDELFSGCVERLEGAGMSIAECVEELRDYLDRVDCDPSQLEGMQSRLAFLQQLERRYGKSIDELIAEKEKWHRELDSLEMEGEERARLEGEVGDRLERLRAKAVELRKKRRQAAARLDRLVTASLEEMRMPDVVFRTGTELVERPDGLMEIDGKRVEFFRDGVDRVEFFVVTNKGEKEGSVCDIASTGETSRIALALKDVMSAGRKSSVLVFDELDAGVGADMGEAIAGKLLSLSAEYQIIAITHMPQIAAAADRHLVVSKRVSGGRTHVEVEEVGGKRREEELARMLGGGGGDKEKVLALACEMLHARETRRDLEGMRP